jgi:phosphoglycerate kinase
MTFPYLDTLKLQKNRIFLRADLNVPIKNEKIVQDFKLESVIPSINYILKNNGKIILGTHIGRPDPSNRADLLNKDLSTQILIPWFLNRGYKIDYEPDLMLAEKKSLQKTDTLLLLENLRFFSGEKSPNLTFAKLLANLADLYVNDAFGNIHRADTSMTLLAQQFASSKRALGLLMEKEIENLEKIRLNRSEAFVIVLGGIKIKDKIEMLENFITNSNKPKALIIGGGIALAFLKAKDLCTGTLEIDEQSQALAKKISQLANENSIKTVFPVDQVILNSKTEIVDINKIPEIARCIDIGPKTVDLFAQEIKKAKVIFANGPMGIYDTQEGQEGTKKILQTIADAQAFSVVGGGDTTAAAYLFGLQEKFGFLSTGGGATLKFLGCKNPAQEMPVLKALMSNYE